MIGRLTEQTLKESAKQLEISYRQCLTRLENQNGLQPYNLVITKEWMLIVNRSQPAANGIPISSLSFLGLLYTETEE